MNTNIQKMYINHNINKHKLIFIHAYVETAVLLAFKTHINASIVQTEVKLLLESLLRFFWKLKNEGHIFRTIGSLSQSFNA